jgi:hypothetical protein
VPGFKWHEQRRSGRRGGIAILVRDNLPVHRVVGNEYAQFVELRLPNGSLCTIANVYLPPTNNLARRNLTELAVRGACSAILAKIHSESLVLLSGDFNARTGSLIPSISSFSHPSRVSCDRVICPRGEWLIGVSSLF